MNRRVVTSLGRLFAPQTDASSLLLARQYATQLAIRSADALKAGPGGRSSVSGVTATIFGCSGFLGRYIAQALGSVGTQLVLPYRCDPLDIQHLRTMGDLGMVVTLGDFNIRDDDAIRKAMAQSNLVINLIGADAETWNYKFEEVHIDIPSRISRIAKELGVERMIHFSALGANAGAPSRRLRTKAQGEEAVCSEMGNAATIFKPAPISGTEDRLFNKYARMIKMMPMLPLVDGGHTRLQPVWVRDVAHAVINALETFDSMGKTYHLAGPDVYTIKELVEFTYQTVREPPSIMSVPANVAKFFAAPSDWISTRSPVRTNTMASADAIDELSADLVLPGDAEFTFSDLSVKPHKVTEGVAIEYLRYFRSGGYDFGTTAPDVVAGGGAGFRSGQAQNA